jgi:DNA-binding beta-propeller fold protein YncE
VNRREFMASAAVLPFALRTVDAWAGMAPLALVTADLEARIVVVDPVTGRVVRHIATGVGPRSVETVGGRLGVVAHTSAAILSIVDARRVRTYVKGFAQPRYTAAHPNGRLAYVTDSKLGDVAVVDVERGRVLDRAELGGPARHVSISGDARTLWVSLGSNAERVAVVDISSPASPRLVARVAPPFLAHDVGFAPDGRHVWVTSGAQHAMAIYDLRTRERLASFRADAPPQHVTFARGVAFVTSGDDGTLRVHALDGRQLRVTKVPVGSYNVQQAWGRVLTPSLEQGTVCVLNDRGALIHRERVARSSHDASFILA